VGGDMSLKYFNNNKEPSTGDYLRDVNCGMQADISYLFNTSLKSFLVLYEKKTLNFFSLHSLTKSASLVTGLIFIP
jgi:hypothetical protein